MVEEEEPLCVYALTSQHKSVLYGLLYLNNLKCEIAITSKLAGVPMEKFVVVFS